MSTCRTKLGRLWFFAKDQRGAAFVEYAVLIAAITVGVIAALSGTLFGDIQTAFDLIGDRIVDAAGG